MRVTNSMLINTMMQNLSNNLSRLDKVQQQMSTGKKIQLPSDDPIIASRSLRFKTDLSEVEQYQKNTDDAVSWLDMTATGLSNLETVIQRMRELTVQSSNSATLTDEERNNIKQEISQLKESIVEIGNNSYAGRYIFAGYDTDTPPFEIEHMDEGDKLKYNGNYLCLGGAFPDDWTDKEIADFYSSHMGEVNDQPEIMMAKPAEINIAAPGGQGDQFKMTWYDESGVAQEETITLDPGDYSNIEDLKNALQQKINEKFPPVPITAVGTDSADISLDKAEQNRIQVEVEDGRIKFTVPHGTGVEISNLDDVPAGSGNLPPEALDIAKLGFPGGAKSTGSEKEDIVYQVGVGNTIKVNIEGDDLFGKGMQGLFETFNKLEMALDGKTSYKTAAYDEQTKTIKVTENTLSFDDMLTDIDANMNQILKLTADIGARSNYADLTKNRLDDSHDNFTKLQSSNEDADMAEVIMNLKTEENVYTASLSAGARIIQPTLLDFLK